MIQFLRDFFGTSDFMPHGHCFLWQPDILWLHVFSDAVVALAYYSIPLGLVYIARKRHDAPFRNLFYLFGAFIILCGTTHLMSIWVIWHSDYGLEGLIKAATALVSIITAIVLVKAMPEVLQLKSPAQLAKLYEDLQNAHILTEQKIQERTAELQAANTRLRENQIALNAAVQAAEAASQAKSDFLANMSHEIRTPMNAVVGLSHLLDVDKLPREKQRQFVDTIRLSAQSLMDLINDLLDLSRLENKRIELERISFNLTSLIDNAVRIMAVRASEKKINLSVHYEGDVSGEFLGDPLRLRQILLNLIGNAVKFTLHGGVSVHVSAQGQNIRIKVEDTGIGIPESQMESIFDKFSQADTSVTRKFGGSGLGLSICRMLVELMGGRLSVASRLGHGSTFTVDLLLPRTPPQDIQAARPGSATHDAPGTAHNQTRRVLLVEDHEPNVLVATTILEDCGFAWDHASSGAQALECLEAQSYDVVLMDIQMPYMDGLTATKAIRKQERGTGKHVPIIGVTAYAMAGDREKCLEAGMDDYITKPFQPDELQSKIRALMA